MARAYDPELREIESEIEVGLFGEFESASACPAFTPVSVENPGGGRVKDKRPPQARDLVRVNRAFGGKVPLRRLAAAALEALQCAARNDGIKPPLLQPTSGFRDPKRQAELWAAAKKRYGSPQEARKWVAPPGSSAHQSGRAIDFYLGGKNSSRNVANLRKLPAYHWLLANARRFGFYPYEREPWHWEYNPPASGQFELFPELFEPELFEFEGEFEDEGIGPVYRKFAGEMPQFETGASPVASARSDSEVFEVWQGEFDRGDTFTVLPTGASAPFKDWIWPMPVWNGRKPVISNGFDPSPSPDPRFVKKHGGVDIMYKRLPDESAKLPEGTKGYFVPSDRIPVFAVGSGVVVQSGKNRLGHSVIIDHGNGYSTFYQHLTAQGLPRKSTRVAAGMPIGFVGHNPAGYRLNHLHFEIWPGGKHARSVDPAPILRGLITRPDMTPTTPGGSAATPEPSADALRRGLWSEAIRLAIQRGVRDENRLTDMVFNARHPERRGRRLQPRERQLIRGWLDIRNRLVRPALRAFSAKVAPVAPTPKPGAARTPPTDPSAYRRFRLTTYHVVDQRDVPTSAMRVPIYDDQGRKLAEGSPAFFAQLSLEGTGRLEDGRLINVTGKKVRVLHDDYAEVLAYHRRNLPGKPPPYSGIVVENGRVVQALAFHEVPANKRGIGYGVQRGIPLVPFRTLAADIGRTGKSDPSWKGKGGLVPPGTHVYIREYDGLRLPDGTRHDGWFVVNDTGGGIFGVHFDVFVGTRALGKQVKHPAVGTVWFPGIEQRIPPGYDYGLKA